MVGSWGVGLGLLGTCGVGFVLSSFVDGVAASSQSISMTRGYCCERGLRGRMLLLSALPTSISVSAG